MRLYSKGITVLSLMCACTIVVLTIHGVMYALNSNPMPMTERNMENISSNKDKTTKDHKKFLNPQRKPRKKERSGSLCETSRGLILPNL